MDDNYYISSLVAQVDPNSLDQVRSSIEKIQFTEVPASSNNGKLVILIDAPSMQDLLTTTDQIREVEGVYSLLPVYQHEEINLQKNIQNMKIELETT